MHIHALRIKNFRRLRDVQIDLNSDISIFVGANNSGKGSVALSAIMHISDELACHPFKLDGFILPAHKIAQHKTSCQLPPSLSDLCESCALVRYQPRCF